MPAARRLSMVASSGALEWYRAGGAPLPVAVYQPIGAASLAASYVNLVSPSYTLTPRATAPLLTAGGWQFQNSALETAFPFLPTWTIVLRAIVTTITGGAPYPHAVARGNIFTNNSNFAVTVRGGGIRTVEAWSRTTTLYSVGFQAEHTYPLPLILGATWDAGANAIYRNGLMQNSSTHPQGGDGGQPLTIGGPDTIVSTGINWVGSIAAVAIYDTGMGAAQVAAVSATMAAL